MIGIAHEGDCHVSGLKVLCAWKDVLYVFKEHKRWLAWYVRGYHVQEPDDFAVPEGLESGLFFTHGGDAQMTSRCGMEGMGG